MIVLAPLDSERQIVLAASIDPVKYMLYGLMGLVITRFFWT